MERGDISNEVSPRWLVTFEAITHELGVPKKKRLQSWHSLADKTKIDSTAVNSLWVFGMRTSVRLELVIFGAPQEYVRAIAARLDEGLTPFNLVFRSENRTELMGTLAFRPDVQGIVDTHTFSWRWGSRGTTLHVLSRL